MYGLFPNMHSLKAYSYVYIHRMFSMCAQVIVSSLTYFSTLPTTATGTSSIPSALYSEPVKGFRLSLNKHTS